MVDYACGTNLKERISSFREIEYQKERLLLRIHEKCKIVSIQQEIFLVPTFSCDGRTWMSCKRGVCQECKVTCMTSD